MPTITFSTEDFNKLVGKALKGEELRKVLDCAKAELDAELTHEMTVKFNDTNQPYLWSPEGLARFFRHYLGKPVDGVKLVKPTETVAYDKKLLTLRPHIACFKATGKKIDDYLLVQLIQLQEKLSENFGKKRQKISIGVYPLNAITFPVAYSAALPTEKFTPLDFKKAVTLKEALEQHPKGKEYGHLLKGSSVYPTFKDAKGEILSLIPVINSEKTGRVDVGCEGIFFDTTGVDAAEVNLVANIFAQALSDRGFTIQPFTIAHPEGKIVTPTLAGREFKLNESHVDKLLGIKPSPSQIKELLGKMGYGYAKGVVTIPCYRNDIMHEVDIIEDIGIAYGYENFEPLPLDLHTRGKVLPETPLLELSRSLFIGAGYQEVMSPVLANKELLYTKTQMKDPGTIEIENYTSQTYSCIRTWLLPQLLDFLSKNTHVDYPHKLFEQGIVTLRGKEIVDEQHLAAVTAHSGATFTEMKQTVEFVLRNRKVKYTISEYTHPSFITGRCAQILAGKKMIGYFGEVHPSLLETFSIPVPVVGCELNLSSF